MSKKNSQPRPEPESLALLVPMCEGRLHLLLALLAAALSVILTLSGAGSWSVIIATVATATVGTLCTRPRSSAVRRP